MKTSIAGIIVRMAIVLSGLAGPLLAQQDEAGRSLQAGIRDFGFKEYDRISKNLPHAENGPWRLVCTMPYNCHFQPSIVAEAPAGKVIAFNSSNPLVLFLTPTESCTTEAGEHTYEAKNWVSGEGAIYTIPPGVTVKAVKYHETGYDTTFAGSFECNDEDYNILWKKAARTCYICMRDHFYDCPDRERVGFWGDGTPELNQCFYVFDTASHRLCKDLVLRKLEPSFYPGQHLEFLGEYGLWFYYLHTGDLQSMRTVYAPTKQFLFETYRFGNPGVWFDWGKEVKDMAVVEECFYYIDLKTLEKDRDGDRPRGGPPRNRREAPRRGKQFRSEILESMFTGKRNQWPAIPRYLPRRRPAQLRTANAGRAIVRRCLPSRSQDGYLTTDMAVSTVGASGEVSLPCPFSASRPSPIAARPRAKRRIERRRCSSYHRAYRYNDR